MNMTFGILCFVEHKRKSVEIKSKRDVYVAYNVKENKTFYFGKLNLVEKYIYY